MTELLWARDSVVDVTLNAFGHFRGAYFCSGSFLPTPVGGARSPPKFNCDQNGTKKPMNVEPWRWTGMDTNG